MNESPRASERTRTTARIAAPTNRNRARAGVGGSQPATPARCVERVVSAVPLVTAARSRPATAGGDTLNRSPPRRSLGRGAGAYVSTGGRPGPYGHRRERCAGAPLDPVALTGAMKQAGAPAGSDSV